MCVWRIQTPKTVWLLEYSLVFVFKSYVVSSLGILTSESLVYISSYTQLFLITEYISLESLLWKWKKWFPESWVDVGSLGEDRSFRPEQGLGVEVSAWKA
jgi:hypothetical protein